MAELDESLFPEIHVVCHACAEPLPIPTGLTVFEAVWMHEPECAALLEQSAAFAEI
jgi:hypothetical protein